MKKTGKMMLALLAVAAMLLSFAACGGKQGNGNTASPLLQGVFEKLIVNQDYTDWKAMFSATAIEEKIDGNSITISAKGEEGVNGDFVFTLDGDYIVNTSEEGDYTGYSLMMFIKNAVAEYYGMNGLLMSGYLAGLDFFGRENTFLTTEEANGKSVVRLYVASAWDMQGLDEMYINDAALEYTDALTENSVNSIINAGKITAIAYGSRDALELIVGEYGENTDLTLRSIQNLIAKLQPNGYDAFAEEFTALQEAEGSGYAVRFGVPQETAENHDFSPEEGYSYVTVTFPA